MKKWIAAILMIGMIATTTVTSYASYNVPEAYMGFSVTEDWHVFSKNMEDSELLDAVGLTAEEINKSLLKSDCEYFITNPKEKAEIYVKVKKNAVANEFYNILETEDEILRNELDRILHEGFSVDQFDYLPEEVVITPYSQMKFVTVPGAVRYDGKRCGMVYGFTFVNGNGIAFMMQGNSETPTEKDMATISEIAGSVSFTVIKEKGEDIATEEQAENTAPKQSKLQYIAGGFGAIALAVLCLYLIQHMRKNENKPETEKQEEYETHNNAD